MQSRTGNETVLVVGAGVIGLSCAHYLSQAGFEVTVIDQSGTGSGCSSGNCGYICPSHLLPLTTPAAIGTAIKSFFDPKAAFRVKPRLSPGFLNWLLQFARRCNRRQMLRAGAHLKSILDSSITEYRQLLADRAIDCEWKESGLLHVLQSEAGMSEFAETDRFLSDHFGVTARRIEGEELPEFDPAFRSGLAGAFYYPGDAYLRPGLLCSNWAKALARRGVTFTGNCSLRTVEKSDGRVSRLLTTQGALQADRYVIAAGAWSGRLASELNCSIPVEPGKGYAVTMQRPAICPKYPMLFPEHNIGVTPFDDSYRLASMMEFVGFDSTIPDFRIRQLRESAEPYLVEPHTAATLETWYGWRPMTWDSLPIIGRAPRLENLFLATGHNMLGMSMATATGRLIAEMMQGLPTHFDASAFSPGRF